MMQDLPEFLEPLRYLTRPFPEAAVEEVRSRKEEAIPHLVAALEWTAANADQVVKKEPDFFLHLYALYLLAEFREVRGYLPAVALAKVPQADDLLGDTITEGLPGILASLSGGDPAPIKGMIEDQKTNEWARVAGVEAIGAMHKADMLSRQAFSGYLGELFAGKLERQPSPPWDILVGMCADFRCVEHSKAIDAAFADGLAHPGFQPLEDVQIRLFDEGEIDEDIERYSLIDSAIDEMSWWHCFDEEAVRWERGADVGKPERAAWVEDILGGETIRRETRKVGRNDPCPCGSGKKYKKCCLV